jgi:hypothetical protein
MVRLHCPADGEMARNRSRKSNLDPSLLQPQGANIADLKL